MSSSSDPYNLQRFVEAQSDVIDTVKRELRSGQKRSHWMWFVFPQMEGIGRSEMAQRFAISSRGAAQAYLHHPVLGGRLRECTALITNLEGRSAKAVFGSPDDRKFRSSMTLFEAVAEEADPFAAALKQYYDGDRDQTTLDLLAGD